MTEMDADERFEMNMSLIAVALITIFTVTPWVPKLILVLVIYALMSKYTWILALGVFSIWYLRKPRPDGKKSIESKKAAAGTAKAAATAVDTALAARAAAPATKLDEDESEQEEQEEEEEREEDEEQEEKDAEDMQSAEEDVDDENG